MLIKPLKFIKKFRFIKNKVLLYILRIILCSLILAGVWFDVALWLVTSNATSFQLPSNQAADVVIVLGCPAHNSGIPSSCQLTRTITGVNLWQSGYAKHLILTGGNTGLGIESVEMAQIASEYGMPDNEITLEKKSLNTFQNLKNSRQIMEMNGWQTAILVSEPYHLYRARQQAKDQNLKVIGWYPALNSYNWQNFWPRTQTLLRDSLALMVYKGFGGLVYS